VTGVAAGTGDWSATATGDAGAVETGVRYGDGTTIAGVVRTGDAEVVGVVDDVGRGDAWGRSVALGAGLAVQATAPKETISAETMQRADLRPI